ncbi:MAG TPA: hypothetical protein VK174_06020 [Chitinophagales bacterium]|nr:hypothetical protein [Chitinophagales bacterium]
MNDIKYLLIATIIILSSCKNRTLNNKSTFSFHTTYKEVQFTVINPTYSSYNFYNSDNNTDIEGEQVIGFAYSETDTGAIKIHQTFNNHLSCDTIDSLLLKQHRRLIMEFDTMASAFKQYSKNINNVRFLITQFNHGCYVSLCLENESTARIELTNVKDSTIVNDFISSIKIL